LSLIHSRASAQAVDQEDAAKAVPLQTVEHVADDGDQRRDPHADRAGIGAEIGRRAVVDRREDGHAERLRGLDRDALGEDEIDAEAELRVLLRAADRHDGAVVALEIRLDLHPVHLGDLHGGSLAVDFRRQCRRAARLR
jgi:hypothetical protein